MVTTTFSAWVVTVGTLVAVLVSVVTTVTVDSALVAISVEVEVSERVAVVVVVCWMKGEQKELTSDAIWGISMAFRTL
jgi:hypothetical protein